MMDDCRDFRTSVFVTCQISRRGFHRIDQTVHIYFAELDQWSDSILMLRTKHQYSIEKPQEKYSTP
jgi:hypothetical protein